MKYEETKLEIMYLEQFNVITLSGGDEELDLDNINPNEKEPGGWI